MQLDKATFDKLSKTTKDALRVVRKQIRSELSNDENKAAVGSQYRKANLAEQQEEEESVDHHETTMADWVQAPEMIYNDLYMLSSQREGKIQIASC